MKHVLASLTCFSIFQFQSVNVGSREKLELHKCNILSEIVLL